MTGIIAKIINVFSHNRSFRIEPRIFFGQRITTKFTMDTNYGNQSNLSVGNNNRGITPGKQSLENKPAPLKKN